MTVIKRIKSKTKSCYLHNTSETTICFEVPGEIYGNNHRIPSFTDPPKPTKIVIPNFKAEPPITSYFVSSADSVGIFFLPKKSTVYVSDLVYEQLRIKLNTLLAMSVSYDEEEGVKSIDVYKWRMPRIIRIGINEIFYYDCVSVKSISAGTFAGYLNYLVMDSKIYFYAKTILDKTRFAAGFSVKNIDYFILNRDSDKNCVAPCCSEQTVQNQGGSNPEDEIIKIKIQVYTNQKTDFTKSKINFGISKFTEFIYKSERQRVSIFCDFSEHFFEILFHAFSVLKNVKIFFVGNGFERIGPKLVYMGEFLDDLFRDRMYSGHDPLPFSQYSNFFIVEDESQISSTNGLVFYENVEPGKKIDASINCFVGENVFFVAFEMRLEEIEHFFDTKIFVNSEYFETFSYGCIHKNEEFFRKNRIVDPMGCDLIIKNKNEIGYPINLNTAYVIEEDKKSQKIEIQNSNLIAMFGNKFMIQGKLFYSDFRTENVKECVIVPEELDVVNIFQSERFYFDGEFYVFPARGVKISKNDFE